MRCGAWGLWMLAAAGAAAQRVPDWWLAPQRLIQTNLREIDASMNLDEYVGSLKDAGANVVLFNVGGIVANYPTALDYHYRNPFMKGDLTAEVVKRLHAEGIRVLARFDFSKVNERIAAQHPEWLSRDGKGEAYPVYNGQVPTCLNGWYQQEGMLRILSEVIDRYAIDGVFFNMIGYPRSDYSGRPLGICQCGSCKRRFREMHGMDLPADDRAESEAVRRYREFTARTTSEQFRRVHDLVKGKNPGLAICTYTPSGVDVIRMESNTPQDGWSFQESVRARVSLLDNPGKQLSNSSVHFPWYSHRLTSVAPALIRKRILQSMVNGAWLDFYSIGPFHAQEDRLGLDAVRDVFRFHAQNERWLSNTLERADVGLVAGGARQDEEVRGLVRILSEAHISYEIVSLDRTPLAGFPALIVPLNAELDPRTAAKLDAYVSGGGRLLLTGGPAPLALKSAGIRSGKPRQERAQGTYIRIRREDKLRLSSAVLDQLDLVYLDGDLWQADTEPTVEGLLRFIPPAMFGPPEKAYYTQVSDIPGLHFRRSGSGAVAWFPWRVGAHFEQQGHAGHASLITGVLDRLLAAQRRVRMEAPAVVELNHRVARSGSFEWVSLINHSGQMDRVRGEPLPLTNLRLHLQPRAPVKRARLLKAGVALEFEKSPDGSVSCLIPRLEAYEIVLFEE